MGTMNVVAGIDIGGTNTKFGLIDRTGNIIASGSIETGIYKHAEDFVATLYGRISELDTETEIIGFGIGAPMGNINNGTIEHSADLPWKGIVPLADLFRKHTDRPVIVTNDANAAAVGEMVYGGAKDMKDFIVITLGTGLGSGFVVDGRLVYGHDGFAGELGHTSIRSGESNRVCGCGKTGCIETYASATGLKRTLFRLMADSNEPSELRKWSFDDLDAKKIHEAAINGDTLALNAFENTGKMLGIKLADVVAHTNPETIFLFGGLALSGKYIFEPTRKHMEENLLSIYRGRVKLLESQLNILNAAVLGSASLVWSDLENH